MLDDLTQISSDALFSALGNQSAQLETLANQALNSGIDKYMNKDYKGAAQEFRRSLGLSPYSDYAVDATKYLAQAYLQLDETDKAIDTYKQALKTMPQRDDLQLALGNLLIAEKRTGEAIAYYEEAVRIYDDGTNRFSLGQAYLAAGRYDDAETQFLKVISKDSTSPNGYYGLGQVYAKQKKYPEAIQEFERALARKKDFHDAYAEIGYTYADMGEMEKAREVRDQLEFDEPGLAELLRSYMNKVAKPKIITAWATGSFPFYLPRRTQVSELNSYLENANTSQTFTMIFQFSKSMDRQTVENPLNWSIKRSTGPGPGGNYNFGLPLADTEVKLAPFPTDVYYDEKKMTATVRFSVSQNAGANATIDPSHIAFSFTGQDSDGNSMHPLYDQFTGFSGHF